MNYVERAIETSLTHINIACASAPGILGMQKESAVLAILGAFGFSSKSVIQRVLGLSREAVNKLVNCMTKK